MLNRNVAVVIVGCAVFCLVIAIYSVGRMNGMEAGLRARGSAGAPAANTAASPAPDSLPQSDQDMTRYHVQRDAEEIGRALLLYMQDYDETLPPAGTPLKTMRRLARYVKLAFTNEDPNNAFLPRGLDSGPFNYVGDTQPLANIPTPANQRVGYKNAPGGRAWVFADGHTSWEPRPGLPAALADP